MPEPKTRVSLEAWATERGVTLARVPGLQPSIYDPTNLDMAFSFTLTGDSTLRVSDIWPDGDHPEHPTVEDVKKRVADDGGLKRILHDWCLADDLDLTITQLRPIR